MCIHLIYNQYSPHIFRFLMDAGANNILIFLTTFLSCWVEVLPHYCCLGTLFIHDYYYNYVAFYKKMLQMSVWFNSGIAKNQINVEPHKMLGIVETWSQFPNSNLKSYSNKFCIRNWVAYRMKWFGKVFVKTNIEKCVGMVLLLNIHWQFYFRIYNYTFSTPQKWSMITLPNYHLKFISNSKNRLTLHRWCCKTCSFHFLAILLCNKIKEAIYFYIVSPIEHV